MKIKITYLLIVVVSFYLVSCSGSSSKDDAAKKDSIVSPIELITQQINKNPNIDSLYKQRAELYLAIGKTEKALADVRMALQINSEKTEYHILLGDIYLAMGNIELSKKSLINAFDMDPRNPEPSLKLAELNLFLQDYEKVYLYANKAIEIDNYNAPAYFIKGFAHLEQDDTAKAITAMQKATQNDAEYYDAFIMLGKIFDNKKDPIAGNYLKTAVRIRPESVEAHYNYGLWLPEHGLFDEAFSQYNALLTIDPHNKAAWYNIGYINLVYFENYNKAIEYFTRAIESDPTYAEAYFNRGLSYEQLNQFDNARSDYNKALSLKHNYENALKALERIENK